MGRFHRHDETGEHSHSHSHSHDGLGEHSHDHSHDHLGDHDHDHSHEHSNSHDHLGDHSGYSSGGDRIEILERIFDENDAAAASNTAAFDGANVRCVNIMSSPGAGKTTLLAHTLKALQGSIRCGVVEGDIETSIDADRLEGFGAQISLLNTGNGFGGECHLDGPMVARALTQLDLNALDLVLIENVGNLVCPAEFAVGAHANAMVYSVTEGEDKPLKYPLMFRAVDAIAVNKIDLLPYLDFDLELFLANFKQINPKAHIFHVSAKTGEGVEEWVNWLRGA